MLALAWSAHGPLAAAGALGAATLQSGAATDEVDAIQCWRRVSRNAVYIGERFTVTLTCSVIETDSARAVPDEVRLEPLAVDVSPFEVVEGRRYADIRRGPRRFFQYQYTLRLIGDAFFGTDVAIPTLDVTYRIERTLDGGSAQQGRELTYVLPAESVRVLSLVPANMADIRELASDSFGDVEARLFRANLTALGAALVGIVALACVLLGGLRFRRERRGAMPLVDQPLPERVIVGRALRELKTLARLSQEQGWNAALVGRALAAFRLAGAVALSRPIAQVPLTRPSASLSASLSARGAPPPRAAAPRLADSLVPHQRGRRAGPGAAAAGASGEGRGEGADRAGQLSVRRGLWRPKTVAVSSALTPEAITRCLDEVRSDPGADAASTSVADDIRRALALFAAARYSQTGDLPTDALTSELDKGITLVRQLWFRAVAPVGRAGRLMSSAGTWWRRVRQV